MSGSPSMNRVNDMKTALVTGANKELVSPSHRVSGPLASRSR